MGPNLLKEFSKTNKAEWKAKIVADLRGKAYEDLLWNHQGLIGEPIYTAEDITPQIGYRQNGAFTTQPHLYGARHWVNYQLIVVDQESTANASALEALNSGADGLVFQVKGLPNFNTLLKDIQMEYCSVSFESEVNLLNEYQQYLDSGTIDKGKITGFVRQPDFEFIEGLGSFKTLNVSLSGEENQFGVANSLAQVLHKGSKTLSQLTSTGINIHEIVKALQFEVGFGKNYFIEIAKTRALRTLAVSMLKGFGTQVEAKEISILSASNSWNGPTEDEYNYLLEATTSAMAAIIGGCNALLIRPLHSAFKEQPNLAIRNARNISSILKDEAYLGKVVDPAAGSYFIESLTTELIRKSWSIFLELNELDQEESVIDHLKSKEL